MICRITFNIFRSHSMVSLSEKRSSTVAAKRTKKSIEIDTVEEEVVSDHC